MFLKGELIAYELDYVAMSITLVATVHGSEYLTVRIIQPLKTMPTEGQLLELRSHIAEHTTITVNIERK